MAGGPRRPAFYLSVLITGFLLGGFLAVLLRQVLPDSPAKAFFTSAARSDWGPVTINLLVVHFTLGPMGIDITLLSVLGVAIAYFVAKSLF
ncbi:MAG: DUF4321 domain-containing protein [Gemmatimonadetes bacterium]|nr:DUF4321 domain-containing protein [Gemmatimonadota bacterium]